MNDDDIDKAIESRWLSCFRQRAMRQREMSTGDITMQCLACTVFIFIFARISKIHAGQRFIVFNLIRGVAIKQPSLIYCAYSHYCTLL
jgi:hypothetical protein